MATVMRILFIGDVVGTPGVNMIKRAAPVLRSVENIDLIIANAENASSGSGLYPSTFKQLREAGIDALTMGDHIYKKMDLLPILGGDEPICKPANYPDAAPGKDHIIVNTADGTAVAVISLLGRTYMRPVDCPFQAIDRVLAKLPAEVRCIVVDVHAEATGDKYQLLHHLKGRVSAVLGTHTHVPTADEQVLPEGTAFICDVGMTGPYASILGRKIERVLPTVISFVPAPFDVASDDPRLAGAIVDIDPATGKAAQIRRIMIDEAKLAALGNNPLPT
jgi:metallophosphoesterase (TIGR00282 family)